MPSLALALALIGSIGVQTVAAGPGRRGLDVALDYQSPASCPARTTVVEQLGVRGLLVDDTLDARRLSIAVTTDPEPFSGRLSIAVAKLPRQSRTLVGHDCKAVVLSLVLIAALALNPPVEAPPVDTPPEGAVSVRPPPAASSAAVAVASPSWFFGFNGRGMSALGVRPALGVGLAVEHLWRRGERFSPSLGLSAGTVSPPTTTLPAGAADFRATLARLDACWFGGVVSTTRFVASPCANVEAGVLTGSGSVAQPQTARRPWLAPGVSVHLLAELTRAVWLSAAATVFAPLVRDEFLFENPNTVIHRTDAVGAALELGLAGALW